MALDVTLQRPDAGATLTLKAESVQIVFQNQSKISPLPSRATLDIDEGYMTRVVVVQGKATGKAPETSSRQTRDDLDTAFLTWWGVTGSAGKGHCLLTWGTNGSGAAYTIRVRIKGLTWQWTNREPGTATNPIFVYTLTLQEVGTVGVP